MLPYSHFGANVLSLEKQFHERIWPGAGKFPIPRRDGRKFSTQLEQFQSLASALRLPRRDELFARPVEYEGYGEEALDSAHIAGQVNHALSQVWTQLRWTCRRVLHKHH